ncbi:MAG: HAMP domain-containing histidine kinase [Deltaproteobacteria bacterium]|nr:HAMP domain-containing histidine kinase [Deltaproteobacteria bacterium]
MTVRGRVTAAIVAIALPVVVLGVTLAWRARRDAAVQAVAAAVTGRMEAVGRDRCEAAPARFGLGPRGRRFGHGRRRGPWGPLARARLTAYDADLRPATPGPAPRLGPSEREDLERTGAALLDGGAIAVRMPWSEGPCAVVVVDLEDPPWRGASAALVRELALHALVLAVALGVALLALGPPLARLRRLSKEVRRAAGEGYGRLTTVGGADEIGEVARAFDEAARRVRQDVERIEARDRALTAYVDATTHDLAIPITVLQGRLTEADAQARQEGRVEPAVLEAALAESQYLAQLVGNMAAAARLETGAPSVERRPVDLVALVERVAARHRPVARHRGLSLEYAVPDEPVVVLGDDILLERAVSNLVHNAIRHHTAATGTAGRVALLLEALHEGHRFRISVRDDGSSVDDALVARLERGEDAPATHHSRGRGLGLRIVRGVAAAHGLALHFARGTEAGLEAHLEGDTQPDLKGDNRI